MADSKAKAAPATFKQPSRKGKKAWRKNVDVTQVQSGLEETRDQITAGGVIAEKPSDQLFAIDTTGDTAIQKSYAKKNKPLKVDEILSARSAVPAVSSRKRLSDFDAAPKPKKTKVSRKELDRLRSIAYGGDAVEKDVVRIGDAADHDPWAISEPVQNPAYSFLEEKKPAKEPVTLKHAPVSLAKDGKAIPAVRKPEAGKSYNPHFVEWANLIEREGAKEVEAEKKRLVEAREEEARIERIIAAQAEPEVESDGNESTWESEWEGFSDPEDNGLKKKRPERKTPQQRNKIKRRKEAERKAVHEEKMKELRRQGEKIKELVALVEEKEAAREQAAQIARIVNNEESSNDFEEVLRKKKLGKAPVPEAPLEVVLADELQDSLRRLKPEGNLLKDRFRSMVVRGRVESRKEISHGKKRKVTVTEKWSYKDWTLDANK